MEAYFCKNCKVVILEDELENDCCPHCGNGELEIVPKETQ